MPLNKVSLHKGAFAWSWHCAVGNGAAMAQVGNHLAPRTGGRRGACRGQEADHVGEGTSHHSDATGLRAGKASEEDRPSMGSFRRRSRNPARVHRNSTEVGTDPTGRNAGRRGRFPRTQRSRSRSWWECGDWPFSPVGVCSVAWAGSHLCDLYTAF